MTTTQTNLLEYDGETGSLYGVWLKNLVLLIITLGIYRAWARTNIRRYVWSSYTIAGDRLEYTGTGGELLRGYMKNRTDCFWPLHGCDNNHSFGRWRFASSA